MAQADLRMRPGCMADLRTVPRALRRTFDPRGRSTRTEIALLFLLPSALYWLALLALTLVLPDPLLEPAAFVATVAVFLPLQAAVARRFHDMGRPGWLALPFAVLSAIFLWDAWLGVNSILPSSGLWHNRSELHLLYRLCWLAMIGVLMLPPKDLDNPYGPNPRPAEKTI